MQSSFPPFRQASSFILGVLILLGPIPEAHARKRKPQKVVRIRSINVEVKNIFDPSVRGENYWPYRVANAVHIRTRPSVILKQLLVRPGDVVNPTLLEESERNLRALPFVKDAKIVQVPTPNGDVDLLVHTQDTWTTQPQLNFGSEGGQNHSSAGIQEENVLGYGKSLDYFYRKNPEGISNEFGYGDPQILNTRLQLNSAFLDTPTGNEEHVNIAQPFYSLETRAASGLAVDRVLGLQKVYENGNQTTAYNQDHLNVDGFAGLRLNDDAINVHRTQLRYHYIQDTYRNDAATTPGTLPKRKALSGPLLKWSLQQSDFIKETFVDRAERIEDVNLGHQTSFEGGYSDRWLGATESALPFTALDQFGFGGDGPWFGLVSYGASGRYNLYASDQLGGRLVNSLYFANLTYYRHLLPEFPLTGVLHFEAAHLQNGDTTNLLSLGGNTGLRGFKVNAFTGNKTGLFNAETRFFYPYEVLHLAFLGGAAFFDAGEAQPQGNAFRSQDIHADVGAGLRIGLTRSTEGSVVRIDLAYAIGPIQQDNRWILSISTGQGFKRASNSYAKFADVPNQ